MFHQCCFLMHFTDFSWDQTCGNNNPSGLWFYPNYDESTCFSKAFSEFDIYDTEKYISKNACCLSKFSNAIMNCCENGEGECAPTGTPVYIANLSSGKCDYRDSSLVSNWEVDSAYYNIEDCCKESE